MIWWGQMGLVQMGIMGWQLKQWNWRYISWIINTLQIHLCLGFRKNAKVSWFEQCICKCLKLIHTIMTYIVLQCHHQQCILTLHKISNSSFGTSNLRKEICSSWGPATDIKTQVQLSHQFNFCFNLIGTIQISTSQHLKAVPLQHLWAFFHFFRKKMDWVLQWVKWQHQHFLKFGNSAPQQQ